MKIYLVILFLLITTGIFSQTEIEKLLNTPITRTQEKDGEFLQRDLTKYIGFVASQTNKEVQGENEEQLWLMYFNRPNPAVKTVEKYFKDAATEFGVPAELLMVIGQVENNWTQVGPSIDKGWGIMHLVDNNYCQTLQEAAEILSLDPQILKDNAKENIRGAAALLKKYAGSKKMLKIEDWFYAIKKFSGLINNNLCEQQAERYYEVLKTGVEAKTVWDEKVKIEPFSNIDISSKLPIDKSSQQKSTDYSPAISDIITCNYTSGRTHSIDTWVHHYIGTGTYAGAVSWFHNCSAQASAHFCIRSSDGQITQCVRVADKAWHCGTTASSGVYNNARSIGVEHEATSANPGLWNSTPMLQASATMVCHFVDTYSIPATMHASPGILGHQEMPGTSTSCPGAMPWTTWINLFNSCNGTVPTGPANLTSSQSACPADNVTFSWTNSGTGWHIDVSTSSSFTTYYWKYVSGLTTFTGPTGFVDHTDGTTPLVFQEGITYYWRITAGSTVVSGTAFTMHTCTTLPANLTATVAACPGNTVNFSWSNAGGSWYVDVSTDAAFATYSNKAIANVTSTNGPIGFSPTLSFQPGITYYWRIYYGEAGQHVSGNSFTMPVCDITNPTTQISAINNWQSKDFSVSFTDADNVGGSGLNKKFYQAIDYNGTEWRGNAQNGFFNDNFSAAIHSDWQNTSGGGTWVINNGQLEQTDQSVNNTIISAALNQANSNTYMYHWAAKISGTGASKRSGLHFFASESTSSNRGDSYLAWFDVDQDNCKIYKTTANVLTLINTYPFTLDVDVSYDYKVVYSPSAGKIEIWINDALVASWTDPSPIISGSYISLRTGNCDGFFDNLKVRKSRGTSVNVSVGNFTNKDVRYQSVDSLTDACRVNTIVNDIHGNWSAVVSKSIYVDWSAPAANISTTGAWKTDDFTASFSDVDSLSGVLERYYQVCEYNGINWTANATNGFLNDNFDYAVGTNWQTVAGGGSWAIVNSQLSQTDEVVTNSNLYTAITQNANYTYMYQWGGTVTGSSTTAKRFGLHFFADDASLSNRGNSYLAFFRFDQNRIEIQKGTNNTLAYADTIPKDLTPGMWYDFKVSYNPVTGLINVYMNDLLMLSWTDPAPITSGSFISLRSGNCNAVYDNLKVYRSRGTSQLITVGSNINDDAQFESPNPTQEACRIKSIAIDNMHNVSTPGSLNILVDLTPPISISTVNDGTGADVQNIITSTTLSANWTISLDPNSGLTKYWYAIGTTSGGTDLVNWTDNGLNTAFTNTGLSLVNGQIYYVSVKAQNGAGLMSSVKSTDGQTVMMLPQAQFSVNNAVCEDIMVSFLDASQNAISYFWTFTGGIPATSTLANPDVIFSDSGAHNVNLVVTNSFGSDTMNMVVSVVASPVADFSVIATDLHLPNADAVFTNATTNATSYLWNFGDGNTSNEEIPWHTYTAVGNYTVTLIATNNCTTDTIIKINYIHVDNPNGISIIGDGIISGIYPNPFSDRLVVKFASQSDKELNIIITDISGKEVFNLQHPVLNGNRELIIENLKEKISSGIYNLVISTTDQCKTYKLIKD